MVLRKSVFNAWLIRVFSWRHHHQTIINRQFNRRKAHFRWIIKKQPLISNSAREVTNLFKNVLKSIIRYNAYRTNENISINEYYWFSRKTSGDHFMTILISLSRRKNLPKRGYQHPPNKSLSLVTLGLKMLRLNHIKSIKKSLKFFGQFFDYRPCDSQVCSASKRKY